MNGFHEILFPLDIALGARGGPERRTDVVALGSNREKRNARWARSRRRWEAGYGVKTFADIGAIVDFFEERRGRLYGFRWRDRADHSSAPPGRAPAAGAAVKAGFLFDTPARFDTDYLEIDHTGFEAGEIPKIPILEILP